MDFKDQFIPNKQFFLRTKYFRISCQVQTIWDNFFQLYIHYVGAKYNSQNHSIYCYYNLVKLTTTGVSLERVRHIVLTEEDSISFSTTTGVSLERVRHIVPTEEDSISFSIW